jgi:hypothetical protein
MKQPRTEKFDIAHFKQYVESYEENYPNSQNIMFLDMLYGIGLSIDSKKFEGFDGFNEFLKWLSESYQFEEAKKRYQDAILSINSPEAQVIEPAQRLLDAFQIAAFGKVIDYKPENDTENDKV